LIIGSRVFVMTLTPVLDRQKCRCNRHDYGMMGLAIKSPKRGQHDGGPVLRPIAR
jgi:hypothetical protein